MAKDFHRNQNPSERVALLNGMSDRVDGVEERVGALEQTAPIDSPAFDPGDLTVYYLNGKA